MTIASVGLNAQEVLQEILHNIEEEPESITKLRRIEALELAMEALERPFSDCGAILE